METGQGEKGLEHCIKAGQILAMHYPNSVNYCFYLSAHSGLCQRLKKVGWEELQLKAYQILLSRFILSDFFPLALEELVQNYQSKGQTAEALRILQDAKKRCSAVGYQVGVTQCLKIGKTLSR
ncbi:MAG: hypothetical protein J0651_04325 [Actinobacteria bacterium]|nr:hypothetical protein [Actinomycetota bacterium]